jgi:hypothetical protein
MAFAFLFAIANAVMAMVFEAWSMSAMFNRPKISPVVGLMALGFGLLAVSSAVALA